MKLDIALLPLAAFPALAFPPWLLERDLEDHEMRRAAWIAAEIEMEAAKYQREDLTLRAPGFDAEKQFIDVSGEHEWVSDSTSCCCRDLLTQRRLLLSLVTFEALALG